MNQKKPLHKQFKTNIEKQLSRLSSEDLKKERKGARRASAWWLAVAGILMMTASSYFDPELSTQEIWAGAELGFGSNISSILCFAMLGVAIYVFWKKPARHRVTFISLVFAGCAALPLFAVPTQTASNSMFTVYALLVGSIVGCLLSVVSAYRAEIVETYKPKTGKA